jgi:Htaa
MKDVTQPVRARGTMLSAVAVVAALAALLALAPLASAASDPLASGTTTLTLNKNLFKNLKKAEVKVIKVSPGTVKVRTVTLPVLGGSLDPTNGLGTIEQNGGIKFKHGKKSALLKAIVVETTTNSINANVAGKKMKLASVTGVSTARNGFGANVTIGSTKLTGKAAKQLNKKLGFTGKLAKKAPFKGGKGMGSALAETQPKTVTVLPGNTASLVTSVPTDIKLEKVGVKIETVSPTVPTAALPPAFAFPVSGGTIAPNATSGIVQTSGGLKLHQVFKPGEVETTMTLSAIYVDLGAKTATVEVAVESKGIDPKLNLGPLGRSSIANLNLTGATIKSDPSARTVSVENATATLQGVTAETLNSVFVTPFEAITKVPSEHFAEGDPLGTFSFTAQTQ